MRNPVTRPPALVGLLGLVAVATLLACARMAGIEDPDPAGADLTGNGRDDGGGGASAGGFTIKPESIAITTSCNVGGAPQYLTLENPSDKDADYELQVPEGSAFALRDAADAGVSMLKGTLKARGVLLAYVRVTSQKAGTFSGVVIARLGDVTKQVPVTVTVTGGALALSPSLVDFGEVRKDTTSSPQTIALENTGTEPGNVIGFDGTSGSTADFTVMSGAGSVNIPPGQKIDVTANLVAGKEGPPLTASFVPRTQVPTCGEPPALTLKGTRVNQEVTVNPVALDFGEVDCASPGGATRTVTISNFGSAPVSFTATTGAASWFAVGPASGAVPKEASGSPGTAVVTVTLKPVGSEIGNHTDTIDIAVAGPAPKTTTVSASVKSVGGILDVSPVVLPGYTPNQTKSFAVRNIGNKFVYVRHESSNAAFAVSDGSRESPLFPGFLPLRVNVTFLGSGAGVVSADITTTRISTPILSLYPSSGRLCASPATVNVRTSP